MSYKLGDFTVKNWNDWDRVPRMPEAVAAYVASYFIGATGAVGFTATAITAASYLAVSAVTSWAISALSPKPDFSSFGSQGTLVNVREATAPADFVYGEVRKGGVVTFYESTGETNKFLHQIIVLAGHEVEEIGDLYVNDEVVTWNESTGFVTSEKWTSTEEQYVQDGFYESGRDEGQPKYVYQEVTTNHIRIRKFHGDQTAAPADLLAESELEGDDALTSNFVGNGIAYLYVRYEYDREVFASGLPLITAKVKGKKVYDPRNQTTAYSNNAALCMRDFLTSEYGLNDDAIDDVSFAAAAWDCDEPVALANAEGTEKRYTLNGIVKSNSPIGSVLGNMSTACAGTLFWGSGYWKLKVGVYSAPVKSLTLDDLRGPINLSTRTSMRDSFNGVSGTFNNAADDYITADYPKLISETDAGSFVTGNPYTILEVGNTDFTAIGASSNTVGVTFTATGSGSGTGKASLFLGEDGGDELLLDLPLPFTTSASAAQRIAKLTLFRGREQMAFSADFGLNAFDVEVGDIVSFTNDRYGFNAKEFEVLGWAFASNQDAGDLRVTLTLQETSAAAFAWDAEETAIISNNTILPDFNTVAEVTDLSLYDGSFFGADGTHNNAISAYWTASEDGFVSRYQVQYKRSDESIYQTTFATQVYARLTSLDEEQLYNVRVRAINTIGVESAWVESTFTTIKDQVAPAAPTIVGSTQGVNTVTVNWVNPTDKDFREVEVLRSVTNDINNASSVAYVSGTYYVDIPPNVDQTYYYFVRAIDRTGNISAPATVTTNSSRLIQSYDVDAGQIDLSKLSSDVTDTLADKVNIADYNITVDYQQQLEDATTQLATDALTLALNASSLESRINDAGITVDPATGSVTIQGLSAVEDQVNEVKIDLDAVEGELSLKATTTYVNDSIAAATLPEASLAALEGLEARVGDVEIDLDSVEGSITLTSTGSYYNVNDGVLGVEALESRIEANEGQITLKASQVEMTDVNTRLGTAEIAINSIDVPSITLAVQDVRSISEKQDDLAELTLQEVLGRYKDREYLLQDSAYARLSLTADVTDEREARATSEFELAAQIDENKALIKVEQEARATEDSAIAESVATLQADLFGDTGSITEINKVSLDSNSAVAQAVAQLNVALELEDGSYGVVESVSEVTEKAGVIESKYAVKVNTNGHVSGFGLISTDNGAVPTSEFIIAADAFKIAAPVGGNVTDSAFSVYTQDTVIGGVTYKAGTYVNGFLNAENINTGTLTADRIALDTTVFETDNEGNLVIVSTGLGADQLKLGGEFKYNPTTKTLEVDTLNANTITSGTINTSRLDLDGTSLVKDVATGELVVGAINGEGNIVNGTITANKLRLGNTTLSSVNNELVVGAINGTGNIIDGTISAGKLKLDNVTLEDNGAGALKVKAIAAEQITSGVVNTSLLNIDGVTLSNVGGSLKVGEVGTGQIADLAITNAKIGDTIQSNNYVSGSSGWRILKNGSAEFNGVVVSRQLQVATGTLAINRSGIDSALYEERFSQIISTGYAVQPWTGSGKVYAATVGITSATVTADSSAPPNVDWGWLTEVISNTNWSAPAELRLLIKFYGLNVDAITGTLRWRVYEVT